MSAIRRSSRSERDLVEIWRYIAAANPEAADRMLKEIDAKIQFLSNFPNAGRLHKVFTEEIRSFPIGEYLIFYKPEESGILVYRILHGARDLSDFID